MPVPTMASATEAHSTALSYEQTVPRGLVHRWSLSEVFLTDYRKTGEPTFACAAQLPSSHAYYRDHPEQPGHHDPLNVLEAGRQAVTYAAHAHQELPRDTTFMVSGWTLDISDAAALRAGDSPGQLRVDGEVTGSHKRGGRIRRLEFAIGLALDGVPLGTLTMRVSCTPTEQYHKLRQMQRGGEVPTAFTLPAQPAAEPAQPASVGRADPANVVLDGPLATPDGVSALLSPRTMGNRSLYDHPYDHVPAMVLSEAARQCALLHDGTAVTRPLRRLDGRFLKFAELDALVRLTGRPTGDAGAFRLTAEQGDAEVAQVDLVFA